MKNDEINIIKKYKVPKCCNTPTKLKFMIYDGGWGDSGAFCYFQCNECGSLLKTRIKDSKEL